MNCRTLAVVSSLAVVVSVSSENSIAGPPSPPDATVVAVDPRSAKKGLPDDTPAARPSLSAAFASCVSAAREDMQAKWAEKRAAKTDLVVGSPEYDDLKKAMLSNDALMARCVSHQRHRGDA